MIVSHSPRSGCDAALDIEDTALVDRDATKSLAHRRQATDIIVPAPVGSNRPPAADLGVESLLMSALHSATDRQTLMMELRWCAAWEDLPGAVAAAERLAALSDDEVPEALASELASLDAVDLSEDSGDVADELWRRRAALQVGLVRCGSRVLACVRPMIGGAGQAAQIALRVLAELGDPTALPVARRWVHDDAPQAHSARLAAIDALGWLQPPDAASLLREAIARPGSINGSWTKRMAAHALGRLGDIVALERLLDDPDWFARLGAAEALAKLPAGQGEAARQRALRDRDERVARAARRQ